MSQPPPMRVESISYQSPVPGRPGILTAVGVMSIVVASLSMIGSCASVVNTIAMQIIPGGRFVPTTSPTTLPAPVTITTATAMPMEQRQIVVATFNSQITLSPQRQEMLDKLLAQAGADMFYGSEISTENVKKNISESGQLPGANGEAGNDYFIISTGRIELTDDHAVYSPTHGESVRVYNNASDDPTTTPSPSTSTLPTAMAFSTASVSSNRGVAIFYGATALISLGLAIFLLIAGILMLRNSRRSRRMHLIYAWLKIPTVIVAGSAYLWMAQGMFSSMPTSVGGTQAMLALGIWELVQAAIACAYPIALLIILNRKTTKDYFDGQ
jgi:hypothetical protein